MRRLHIMAVCPCWTHQACPHDRHDRRLHGAATSKFRSRDNQMFHIRPTHQVFSFYLLLKVFTRFAAIHPFRLWAMAVQRVCGSRKIRRRNRAEPLLPGQWWRNASDRIKRVTMVSQSAACNIPNLRFEIARLPEDILYEIIANFEYSLLAYDWAVFLFAGEGLVTQQLINRATLCKLALVNHQFNQLASPMLYRYAVPISSRESESTLFNVNASILGCSPSRRKQTLYKVQRLFLCNFDHTLNTSRLLTLRYTGESLVHFQLQFNRLDSRLLPQMSLVVPWLTSLQAVVLSFPTSSSDAMETRLGSEVIHLFANSPKLQSLQLTELFDVEVYGPALASKQLKHLTVSGMDDRIHLQLLQRLLLLSSFTGKLVFMGCVISNSAVLDMHNLQVQDFMFVYFPRPKTNLNFLGGWSSLKTLTLAHFTNEMHVPALPPHLASLELVNCGLMNTCTILQYLSDGRGRPSSLRNVTVSRIPDVKGDGRVIMAFLETVSTVDHWIQCLKKANVTVKPDRLSKRMQKLIVRDHVHLFEPLLNIVSGIVEP